MSIKRQIKFKHIAQCFFIIITYINQMRNCDKMRFPKLFNLNNTHLHMKIQFPKWEQKHSGSPLIHTNEMSSIQITNEWLGSNRKKMYVHFTFCTIKHKRKINLIEMFSNSG